MSKTRKTGFRRRRCIQKRRGRAKGGDSSDAAGNAMALPKGHLDPGETAEQAALREVNEEAGVVCELIAPIDSIEYWFTTDRSAKTLRIHKTVHFF